ncbi:cytochrome b-c1 complex subunit Rieske [Striga asiatica]|uniref:Cytochrome b-c1 complex subunit Rieske n=1 Tax=Striga asiatica TaxID=4170 RepID=A0A5A7QX41_STRAF|nr:cytochrome b-c1 complex subunit Rieske [Striga asiatica]
MRYPGKSQRHGLARWLEVSQVANSGSFRPHSCLSGVSMVVLLCSKFRTELRCSGGGEEMVLSLANATANFRQLLQLENERRRAGDDDELRNPKPEEALAGQPLLLVLLGEATESPNPA